VAFSFLSSFCHQGVIKKNSKKVATNSHFSIKAYEHFGGVTRLLIPDYTAELIIVMCIEKPHNNGFSIKKCGIILIQTI